MVAVSPDEISAARDMEAATRQAIAALLESINGASSIPQESRAAMWAEAPALLTLVVVPVVYHLLDQVVPLARAVPGLARLTPGRPAATGLASLFRRASPTAPPTPATGDDGDG